MVQNVVGRGMSWYLCDLGYFSCRCSSSQPGTAGRSCLCTPSLPESESPSYKRMRSTFYISSCQKLFRQLILNKNVVIQQNFKLDYIVYRDFHERKRLLSAKAIVLLRNKKLSLLWLQHQTRMQVECDLKRVQWPSFWPHWQWRLSMIWQHWVFRLRNINNTCPANKSPHWKLYSI
jgi:hypothetical protein